MLYRIVRKKHVTVAKVLNTVPVNVSFRRALTGDKLIAWFDLVSKVATVILSEEKDIFWWDLHGKGSFTLSSMYNAFIQTGSLPRKCVLWKLKVPLKIKVFLWYLKTGVILTKDNLAKRCWQGSTKYCFCNATETIKHLFFYCHVARFFWNAIYIIFNIRPPSNVSDLFGSWLKGFSSKLRIQILVGATALYWAIWLSMNDVVFNRISTKSILQVVFRGIYWIREWMLLFKEEERNELKKKNAGFWRLVSWSFSTTTVGISAIGLLMLSF
jgi:hypothetical protein